MKELGPEDLWAGAPGVEERHVFAHQIMHPSKGTTSQMA